MHGRNRREPRLLNLRSLRARRGLRRRGSSAYGAGAGAELSPRCTCHGLFASMRFWTFLHLFQRSAFYCLLCLRLCFRLRPPSSSATQRTIATAPIWELASWAGTNMKVTQRSVGAVAESPAYERVRTVSKRSMPECQELQARVLRA